MRFQDRNARDGSDVRPAKISKQGLELHLHSSRGPLQWLPRIEPTRLLPVFHSWQLRSQCVIGGMSAVKYRGPSWSGAMRALLLLASMPKSRISGLSGAGSKTASFDALTNFQWVHQHAADAEFRPHHVDDSGGNTICTWIELQIALLSQWCVRQAYGWWHSCERYHGPFPHLEMSRLLHQ
jgi:hypothetical protein